MRRFIHVAWDYTQRIVLLPVILAVFLFLALPLFYFMMMLFDHPIDFVKAIWGIVVSMGETVVNFVTYWIHHDWTSGEIAWVYLIVAFSLYRYITTEDRKMKKALEEEWARRKTVATTEPTSAETRNPS